MWWVVGCHIAAALWGTVSRTCSILLATFLCNYCQAFSPSVLSASMWCILIARYRHDRCLEETALHFIGQVCLPYDRPSQLMRHCSLSRWTCQLVLECYRLVWEMLPVWLKHIYSILCALTWRLMPAVARSRLCSRVSAWAGAICQKRYIIGVVGIGNCLRGIPSASFFC